MTLTPALGRQRQADLCEFEASLVYKSSRTGSKATEKPCLEELKTKQKKTKKTKKDEVGLELPILLPQLLSAELIGVRPNTQPCSLLYSVNLTCSISLDNISEWGRLSGSVERKQDTLSWPAEGRALQKGL